ncbi:MAG: trigger factor [Solirubrobacteraceae bacterium]
MSSVKTNVTALPESRVRVEAEVPAEEVERRVQEAARELGRQMRVPGFRKGKVPPPVVIRRLGRQTVLDEALRSSLGSWYADAIDVAQIAPIGEPELDLGELPGEGQPLAFSIEIGVRPKAKLGEYRGLEVARREPEVPEAAIDAEVQSLREQAATLETVDRPAVDGDHVVIDYTGRIDDEAFGGGEGRDQLIELGSGRLLPGFEAQLEGASAGERRNVELTFPEAYREDLAGKTALFDVTVSEVKAKRLPELGDEFAADSGGFDTLAQLREDIATRLRHADSAAIEREFEQAVLDAAAARAEIEVPDQLVHARAHQMLEQALSAFARQGVSKEAYLGIAGKTEEELAHEAEPDAADALRREAVLAAVVEAEQLEPSEKLLLEALQETAQQTDTTPEKLLAQLRAEEQQAEASSATQTGKDGRRAGRVLARLREDLAARQALELLVSTAKPIAVEQASARDQLWTPDKDDAEAGPGKIWTPGG